MTQGIQVVLWDKARGAGGRMSTSRSPSNAQCIADLGAQYISNSSEYEASHKTIYEELMNENLIKPLDVHIEGLKKKDDIKDYVTCQAGMSSVVKHFLGKSKAEIKFSTEIKDIHLKNDIIEIGLKNQETQKESFDGLVLTMPVPQILQLVPNEILNKPGLKSKLEQVKYSSRYALALFYDNHEPSVILNKPESGAHYIQDDPIFCYAAIDSKKKGLKNTTPTSVIFHTKVPWGLKHLETPIPQVEQILVQHYKQRYPDWPVPQSIKCLRWRYSQVFQPFENSPGAVVLNEKPLILAAGDGFMQKSGFDACLKSASVTSQLLLQHFGGIN